VAAVGLLALRAFQAPVAPVSYSLAGRSMLTSSGQANALVWVARYGAFLAGPLLIGVLGDRIGLRATLAMFVVTSLAIAWLAHRNREVLDRTG
jgi:fucose permease